MIPARPAPGYGTIFTFVLVVFGCVAALCFVHSCRNVPAHSHPQYFDTVFTKAGGLQESPNRASALSYLDSAFSAFHDPGIIDLYRKYAFKENWYTSVEPRERMAATYADSMLWVMRGHLSEKEFAEYYSNALVKKGDLLLLKKDYTSALENYYHARTLIEGNNDSCLISSYTFVMGNISYKQDKFLDAARYMIQGVREVASCGNTYQKFQLIQARLDDIGLAYGKCGMPDSALYYFKKAIAFLQAGRESFAARPDSRQFIEEAQAVVVGNMGDIYLMQGDTAAAEYSFMQSVRTNSQPGYARGDAQLSQYKLVRLCLWQNRLAEARDILQQLRGSLDSFPAIETELKWYGLQIDYLGATGQMAEAYPYIKPYLKLKDSSVVLNAVHPVDIKEEDKRLYNLVMQQRKSDLKDDYLIIATVFFALVIVIAFLFWCNWKRTRKLNARIVTQNKEMQLALSSLTESQKDNTRMMQIVAHDLRNPINSMISIASILLEQSDLDPGNREMMELMKTSSLHSIDMISDLLNVNTTAEHMNKAPEDIHTLLRYCVDLMQFRAGEKKQVITLDAQEAQLLIHKEKIWRVMSNLIVNAIKFSPEGSAISVRGFKGKNEYHLIVQDHGIGIPEDIRDKVFNMFTDAKRLGTSGERSFGLGLAISRQIVDAHGGKIWFESKIGEGTSFFVSLPA